MCCPEEEDLYLLTEDDFELNSTPQPHSTDVLRVSRGFESLCETGIEESDTKSGLRQRSSVNEK